MLRLKSTQVKAHRDELLAAQAGRCALCGEPVSPKNPPVLDHDHKTGLCRAVLHRGCNAALGHVENNRARYFMTDPVRLSKWARAIATYLTKDYTGNPYHPTFKTEDEKRERRNKQARARRAAARDCG